MISIVDSTIVGVAKPDPAIFSFALEVLGVKAERVAYVGDSYANDVVGATGRGHCSLSCSTPTTTTRTGDYPRIKAVSELLSLAVAR